MKRARTFPAILIALIALTASAAWAGGNKVQVCHIPPGDPANFHTITVSENAVQAHLGHGDFLGACSGYCDQLCDDGNACTVDTCDALTGACAFPPVSCPAGQACNPGNGACEGTVPPDGCPDPPPGTTCPCMEAFADFATVVGSPGTCVGGLGVRKEAGGLVVEATCENPGNIYTGLCSAGSDSSGFSSIEITTVEGTACVRLIRASCAP